VCMEGFYWCYTRLESLVKACKEASYVYGCDKTGALGIAGAWTEEALGLDVSVLHRRGQ
jgi:hypothetical protein